MEGISDIQQAAELVERCMAIDRVRLGRRVRELARLGGAGREPSEHEREQMAHVAALVRRSVERREDRERQRPRIRYDLPGVADLPVVQVREKIAAAIESHQVVVVCGATGSGKTTQLPKICLEVGRGAAGLIGHTQPRRIAARSVAQRIAQELGSSLGPRGAVGYKVRFTDQSSRGTYVKLMTDGILLAETQGDRLLAQYDTLIIDEAHERSLNIDFLLGYLRQLLPKRPDLKVVVTSATIDPQSFAEHFADERTGKPAPVIEVSGRSYPVEVRHRPLKRPAGVDGGEEDVLELEMEEAVVEAVRELIGEERSGGGAVVGTGGADGEAGVVRGPGARDRDILVFLPGEREIRETADELKKAGGVVKECEIVPLFARLSTEEQNRVFEKHERRRIILATNVVETSLTVPGIKYVIDAGLARISRYSPRIKVQRLPIEPVSQASAMQRCGRCGRTSPGVCIRLYSEDDFGSRPAYTDPEILRTNLASVILQMKALRLVGEGGDVSSFPFMQPPDPRAVRDGYDTLIELGAFDAASGELTDVGWRLARLPVDPRIGRMILAAMEEKALAEVLVIAAALSVQDPRLRPADRAEQADAIHEKWRDPESDFVSFLKLWRDFKKKERELSGGQLRKWCAANMLSYVRMREWQEVWGQLSELAGEMNEGGKAGGRRSAGRERGRGAGREVMARQEGKGGAPASYDQIHRALLTGLISNIGNRSASNPFEYEGVRGLRFSIFPGSGLFKEKPKWVMAAELVRTTRLYARTVARIQPQWIERAAGHLVGRTYEEPHWMSEAAQVGAYETVTLWGLPIIKRRRVHYGPVDPRTARGLFIQHALVNGEYLSPGRFFEENFRTQKQIQKMEEKRRKHDLLAEPAARFEFYAQKVPEDVYDGPGFERWRKKVEARQPDLLVMQKEDLLAPGAVEPPAEQFPDAIDVPLKVEKGEPARSARIGLEYKHKHGDPEDGITAIIPAALAPLVDERRFEWLVPGLAPEKVVELIKTLPKGVRVNLSPAAKSAEEAVRRVKFGEGAFLPAIAGALSKIAGTTIEPEQFGAALLPDHLKMNFRVVEETPGEPVRVVGRGRDLGLIRRELADRAAAALSGMPAGPLNRSGVVAWDLGELPRSMDVRHRGAMLRAYPALVDETTFGEHGRGRARVGVRPLATGARAEGVHRRGVVRLLAMQVKAEAESLIEHTPGIEGVLLNASTMMPAAAVRQDLAELIALRAFDIVPGVEDVRTAEAFESALNAGWNNLGPVSREVVGLAEQVFAGYQRVSLLLGGAPAAWAPTVSDVRHQLALLVGPAGGRFLVDTPFEWLRHYPRYLTAIALRLEKCGGASRAERAGEGLERDWRLMNEVMPMWAGLIEKLRLVGGLGGASEALVEFRWLLEELRVSLFAQELRTAVSVSPKKLAAKWADLK